MSNREEICRAIEELEQRGRGKRYPGELRKEIESYTAARGEQGASLKQIAEELAISWRTLERWRRVRRPNKKFRRVELVAERDKSLTVHGPCGVRVEGMDVAGVAELVRRLA